MLLKVGELAKRAGLTVRTLHHYDRIDLLKPSARSEAGYRLYNRQDVARLHKVQALQRLGLSLTEIGTVLIAPKTQLPDVITQQLRMLTQQIEQATRLQQRLTLLQAQLCRGEEPDLDDWLKTLELMHMYDKYFTPDELKRLPTNLANRDLHPEWAQLVDAIQQLIDSNTPTDTPAARDVARHWFTVVERDITGDPILLAKFAEMHDREPVIRQQSGITKEIVNYIQQASIHDKLAIYKKYLSAEEFAYVSAHYGNHILEWPPLITDAYQAMQSGQPATAPTTLAIARRWLQLVRTCYGDHPDTPLKIREAHAREPELLKGSLISDELLHYLRQAFAHLHS